MNPSEFITADNLSFSYNEDEKGKKAVENLSFTIERGSFVAVIGHNGSGKSTLAKLMCGILAPESGDIYIQSRQSGRTFRPMRYALSSRSSVHGQERLKRRDSKSLRKSRLKKKADLSVNARIAEEKRQIALQTVQL